MCMFEKWEGIESWTNNRKDTIKTDRAHRKENPIELLEMKNIITIITKNRSFSVGLITHSSGDN